MRSDSSRAVEAFEITGSAVALLNRRGEVLRLNRAAEALLCADLRVIEKRIISHDRLATAALDRAIHALLWTATSSALLAPVVLPRRARRPILAYPVKLTTVSVSVFADCQALLVFVDLEQRRRPAEEALHASFGLTAAEARLAIRMASGAVLETVADELRISKETARNQLKAVFHKTGVRRQPELVALLASFPEFARDASRSVGVQNLSPTPIGDGARKPFRTDEPQARRLLLRPLPSVGEGSDHLSTGSGALASASAALQRASVIDLERWATPPQEALHSSFGLTAAEPRLAIRMASGAVLESVADELRISKETARNQLKAVFHKTGVRRQAELAALLASFLNSRT